VAALTLANGEFRLRTEHHFDEPASHCGASPLHAREIAASRRG
jgi:hypothetical protein